MKKGILFSMLLVFLLLIGCSNSADSDSGSKELEDKIKDELKIEAVIPDEPFEMLSVIKHNPPIDAGMKKVTINYGIKKGDLKPEIDSQKEKDQWEETNNAEIWYGIYQGEPRVEMNISDFTVENANTQKETEISGYNVQMSEKKLSTGDVLFTDVNLDKGSYSFTFYLNKDFTKEDAMEWLRAMLEQLREK
ncbi:hypothetical protein [Pseudalkalibacillus salsuginis]|uniref:hypothetical protein n=1 Tax=Pseudalkalibacillus salsuginis TaxID=2910972 RepID=UPI001F3AB105|nr:hypothetical protein [Pseudalkalibacillus salsuginis]MCF6412065.1 hypothetical protein [Pseudalkalibacillus salsuginis]